MRVVGGDLAGRRLITPQGNDVRPTSDRLRETLFNILIHGFDFPFDGARVLDLFAGTGALGIESLSRGAAEASFVERSPQARAIIHENLDTLDLAARAHLLNRDATRLGSCTADKRFSLVFADPPYKQGFGDKALVGLVQGGWLEENALVIVEESADAEVTTPDGLHLKDERRVGKSQILFLTMG